MIVWTDNFPQNQHFRGYLRLLMARHRYFVHYGLDPFGLPVKRPGYQMTMRSWRDMYKGQRCFVIGNGPSLQQMDLSPLRDEITIGCNGIYKKFPEWGFPFNYLLFEDTEQTELRGPEIHDVKGPYKMAGIYNAYAFRADPRTLFFNARRADPYYWKNIAPRFSEEFEQIVYLGSTVTYIGLQLAFHLGCDPVYLIGVDHSYGELGKLFPPGKVKITEENYPLVQKCHFDPNYYKVGQVIGVPDVKIQEDAYRAARETYEKRGRRVFNAGVNSMLDVFERCSYDDLVRERRWKVLFISHAATRSGAPISLQVLMRYFKEKKNWNPRILVRKKNGPIQPFQAIAPSNFFYMFQYPNIDGVHSRSVLSMMWSEFLRLPKNKFGVVGAFRRLLDYARRKHWQRSHVADLGREFQQWRPDLIYSNTAVNGDVIRQLGLEGVPVVVHVRELAESLGLLTPLQIEEFKRRPARYLAVSGAVREHLMSQYGVPDEKIDVAPVAVECEAMIELAKKDSIGTIRKKKLPFTNKSIIIGGVGFLNKRKGCDIFVDVAKRVLDAVDAKEEVRFAWLGEGPEMGKMRQRVKDLGIHKEVVFTGMQQNPYPYIRVFDFVLMTSRDDPFPRINLEAAAFGKPIITFAASGGSREFAADDCGVIVPGMDVDAMVEKTIELITNKELRLRLGENAKQKVNSQYSVEAVASAIAESIDSHFSPDASPRQQTNKQYAEVS